MENFFFCAPPVLLYFTAEHSLPPKIPKGKSFVGLCQPNTTMFPSWQFDHATINSIQWFLPVAHYTLTPITVTLLSLHIPNNIAQFSPIVQNCSCTSSCETQELILPKFVHILHTLPEVYFTWVSSVSQHLGNPISPRPCLIFFYSKTTEDSAFSIKAIFL
jgi:hypothetical protein